MNRTYYAEDELLPISALQHFVFCERQCALIHTEQVWAENRLTAEGRLLHEHVHEADNESRGDVRVVRGLRLRSLKLGLTGVADVVEFHRTRTEDGITLPGIPGRWHAYPVEYKRGRPKPDECAAKACLDYGQRVQNSVFECDIDPAQWAVLKERLIELIDEKQDSLRFYYLGKNWQRRVEHVGAKERPDLRNDPLLV